MNPSQTHLVQTKALLPKTDEDITLHIVLQHDFAATTQLATFLEAEVRLLDTMLAKAKQYASTVPTPLPVPASVQQSKRKAKKSVQWKQPETRPMCNRTLPGASSCKSASLPQQQQAQQIKGISDLCANIQGLSAARQWGMCFGYLVEAPDPRRHGLFWPQFPLIDKASPESVRLGALLEGKKGRASKLSVADGRRLAVSLAIGMLRLYDTPWLGKHWGRDDIVIFTDNGKLLADHPFVTAELSDTLPVKAGGYKKYFDDSPVIRNETLFALGVVLIELSLDESFDALIAPEDLSPDGSKHAASDFLTVTRVLPQVYDRSGGRYGDVVRRCIHCDFDQRQSSLEDEAFRTAVYDNVVAVLEEDKRQFFNL
jgi:hypothetical protein